METNEFLSLAEKRGLYNNLILGEKEAVEHVITELDRLEGIIRNYESGLESLIFKHDSNLKKKIKTK
jgi:hypothetical protein